MQLVKVHLQGYRRFVHPTSVDVSGPLTVLIGPNEAGKSSLLDALTLWGASRNPFATTDQHSSLSGPEHCTVELEFRLSPAEQKLIEGSHLSWPYQGVPQRFFLAINALGTRTVRVEPVPPLNTIYEENIRRLLQQLTDAQRAGAEESGFDTLLRVLEGYWVSTATSVTALSMRRQSADGFVSVSALKDLRDKLKLTPDSTRRRLEHPVETYERVIDAYLDYHELRQRPLKDLILGIIPIPSILQFTARARELKSLTAIADIGTDSAIANLLIWGGVNLRELHGWIENRHEARVITALQRASRTLTGHLHQAWPFENIGITLQLSGEHLRLLMEPAGDQPFEQPEQRSDGMRLFLALLAFLARHQTSEEPVVLLLDELEVHLHVDAQREVVRWLERQDQVNQVIYSTHSPFSLPSDWTNLRAVTPDPATGTSRVMNRIWSDRRTDRREGLTRLLFQMGAGAAVFNAAQAVLVTEGVTDVALLPRLLGEALGRSTLGVPTVPGFSEAQHILAFEPQGARVAYLFDGDKQGRLYQRKVWGALSRAAGGKRMDDVLPHDRSRVLTLESGLDLEDYLHPDFYAAAINHHLSVHAVTDARMSAANLPARDRPAFLKQWAAAHGVSADHVDKRSVTEALLDLWWEHEGHIDPRRVTGLKQIAHAVETALHLQVAVTH